MKIVKTNLNILEIIDRAYTGEIGIISIKINELDNTERRNGRFGSTGINLNVYLS